MFDFEKCILYSVQQMNIWPCKNCIKTQERENRRDLYTPALSLFNYHTKVKYNCLYQFLINITLSISIRKISEVLKQRLKAAISQNTSASQLQCNVSLRFFCDEAQVSFKITSTLTSTPVCVTPWFLINIYWKYFPRRFLGRKSYWCILLLEKSWSKNLFSLF